MFTPVQNALLFGFFVVVLSACGGGGSPTTFSDAPEILSPKQIALNKIKAYASDDESPAPDVQDYIDAGVTGVNSDNLLDINQMVTTLTAEDVDTTQEIIALTTQLAINIKPTANAGTNKTVRINQAVSISGSGVDSDGSIVSYVWKEGNAQLATSSSFSYTPTTLGTHTLTLVVTDNDGATHSDTVNILVVNVPVTNQIPTANAGEDRVVQLNQNIMITGSGSDTDGKIAKYEWKEGDKVLSTNASFSYVAQTPGTHTLILKVTDNQGASATDSMEVVATSAPDTTAPVIALNGGATVNIAQGSVFREPGATAFDNTDGNISANIVIGGATVNTSAPVGTTFTLTYNVNDAAGNHATQKTRTVTIIAFVDNVSPVITRLGSATVQVIEGASYSDAGAMATDNVDGNITQNIVVGGDTVNTNTPPGTTFMISYNVSDAAGNAAIEVTRTVTIIADPNAAHFIPAISDAAKQNYLMLINNARATARTCGGTGNFPAVPAVSWSDKLYKASYEHSQDLAQSNTFSHDGSGTLSDWTGTTLNKQSNMVERVATYNYRWLSISENISAGTVRDTAQEAIDSWLNSPGHCHNIMSSSVTQVGMAHYQKAGSTYTHYWTQNFGRPR